MPTTTDVVKPDLTSGGAEVRRLLDHGFTKPAFVVACAMIENLAAYAAAWQNRKPADLTLHALVRDLVVHGIIDENAMRKIYEAQARRDTILHDAQDVGPTRGDVEALLELGLGIDREILSVDAD